MDRHCVRNQSRTYGKWISWDCMGGVASFCILYNKLYAQDLLDKGYTGITADAHRAITDYVSN